MTLPSTTVPEFSLKILDRIKKMMALANSPAATEGERDTALRMSYSLLAKYNLSMLDIDEHNLQPQEKRQEETTTFVVYPWARHIAVSVADLFFCKYYFRRPSDGKQATHAFIGKESNATTCAYMAEFVVRSVMKEASRMYGSAIAPEARNFAVGAARRIQERVAAIRKNEHESDKVPGTALMLVNLHASEKLANEAWLTAQGVTLVSKVSSTKGVTNNAAYQAGKSYGGTVSLSAQIENRSSSTRRIA